MPARSNRYPYHVNISRSWWPRLLCVLGFHRYGMDLHTFELRGCYWTSEKY